MPMIKRRPVPFCQTDTTLHVKDKPNNLGLRCPSPASIDCSSVREVLQSVSNTKLTNWAYEVLLRFDQLLFCQRGTTLNVKGKLNNLDIRHPSSASTNCSSANSSSRQAGVAAGRASATPRLRSARLHVHYVLKQPTYSKSVAAVATGRVHCLPTFT
ncbi:hypothetical protein J6590_029475 [Homalodisca vitripennis]|nr:hypothetical protein J6590_029475 [Homalodisca vitripennis]